MFISLGTVKEILLAPFKLILLTPNIDAIFFLPFFFKSNIYSFQRDSSVLNSKSCLSLSTSFSLKLFILLAAFLSAMLESEKPETGVFKSIFLDLENSRSFSLIFEVIFLSSRASSMIVSLFTFPKVKRGFLFSFNEFLECGTESVELKLGFFNSSSFSLGVIMYPFFFLH